MSTDRRTRAWIEVQAGAVRRNLRRVQESVGRGAALIPMVKADAYGLGMSRAIAAMAPVDPWGYGVATVQEAAAVRALGVELPVLVFSPLPPGSYDTVVELAAVPCVSDIEAVARLQSACRRARAPAVFHIEVDTGMGRAGFDWRRAAEWGAQVAERCDGIRPTGVFTHFHSADQGSDSVHAQWQRLEDARAALPWPRDSLMVHVCNSAAALRLPGLAADAVRPGIFLYGGAAGRGIPPPEPAVTVRSRIVLVKEAPPGSTLGYGATHEARGWERWATVAIGYGDGLPRSLGNRGHALVGGERVRIIGRISMDMTVVDITDLADVEVGDVATLIGSDGTETILLEEVAELAGTINYEILTGLTQRLPRIWLDDGQG